MTQFIKVYVAVILRVDEDGRMKPLAIEWEDGRRFDMSEWQGQNLLGYTLMEVRGEIRKI